MTNLGHMLVVTRRHFEDLYEMPPDLDADVMASLRWTALAVQRAFDSTGTTITQNNGPPGQDVFHTHFHVIPRYSNDYNLTTAFQIIDLSARIVEAARIDAAIRQNQGWLTLRL